MEESAQHRAFARMGREKQEICEVQNLGTVSYEPAWKLQERLAEEIAAGERRPTLLLLEHPHTYTFGRRGHIENLLWDEEERKRRGIEVHWVDRGGDVTYHGPGQLVGYPLLPLVPVQAVRQGPEATSRVPQADYVGYLRRLEQVLIQALKHFGVQGETVPGMTGVWVQSGPVKAKIAAIGVKVDVHGVTRHGFALNVAPDMHYWDGIIGCGLAGAQEISLAGLLDPAPSVERVSGAVTDAFGEVFGYRMVSGAPSLP